MLKICKKLFYEFNKMNIRYCHWKSNEHLTEGLEGKTDLDILIDRNRYRDVNKILFKYNFKKYEAISYLKYNSIEDFIGFDEIEGNLVHIHLHYELRLGRKFIKEYHLPIEEYIFNNLIYNENYNIYLISPELEIILLLVRFVAKKRNKFFFMKKGNVLNKDFRKEFDWLYNKISYDKVYYHANILFGKEFADAINLFIKNNNDVNIYKNIGKITLKSIKIYKNLSDVKVDFLYLKRKFNAAYNYINFKKLNKPAPYRRINPYGGIAVAFIGVDGAGKSALIKRIKKWLSWKIDVYVIYFGSGEGMGSLLRYPLTRFVSLVKRKKAKEKINKKNNTDNTNKVNDSNEIVKSEKVKKSVAYRLFKIVWAITLGFEKKSKFKRLWKAKEQGLIVICDRYPQIQVMGFNDGPLLYKWINSRNRIKRRIAKWEYNIYKLCNVYNPDILIKLRIPEEISRQRKPETPIMIIKDKIDAVEKIKYNTNTQIYSIDTDEEIEKVLLKIKKIIWKY